MDCSRDWSMCDHTAQECCAKLYPDDTCRVNEDTGNAECLVAELTNVTLWKTVRQSTNINDAILKSVANDIAFTGLKLFPSANRKVCALK